MKIRTVLKGVGFDACYAFRDGQFFQTGASLETVGRDSGYVSGQSDCLQIHTGFKCLVSDQIHTIWHLNGSQMRVILKCMGVYDLDGFWKHKIP